MNKTVTIEIQRYNPEQNQEPQYQKFQVPFVKSTSVLEALFYIKENLSSDLSFRWSCRMAVCGSCGMMVNGKPSLACKTFVRNFSGHLRIEPLHHFPIERDLVVVYDSFLRSLEAIKPYVINNPTPQGTRSIQSVNQLEKYRNFAMCINCGLCYAACPQFGLNPEFLGPGVIALGMRYNLDTRDRGHKERSRVMNQQDIGVWNCTFIGSCSAVCPKHVDPSAAVQQAKAQTATDYLISIMSPQL